MDCPSSSVEERKTESISKPAPHILTVDDEPLVRWTLETMLVKLGFRVTTANSAEEAIIRLQSTHFDLVITDMILPRADGFEVATKAKHQTPRPPVIMISAFGDQTARDRARKASIDYFVDKPFNVSELANLVAGLVG